MAQQLVLSPVIHIDKANYVQLSSLIKFLNPDILHEIKSIEDLTAANNNVTLPSRIKSNQSSQNNIFVVGYYFNQFTV